jgi:hypothetical protein
MFYTYFFYFLYTIEWCIGKLIIAVKTKDSQADVMLVQQLQEILYTCDDKSTL